MSVRPNLNTYEELQLILDYTPYENFCLFAGVKTNIIISDYNNRLA